MKRIAFVCSVTLALGAALADAWENWEYSRPLTAPPAADGSLVKVALPIEVFGRSQELLHDLRVIDDAGEEVPFLLHTRHGRRTREWRNAPRSESGYVQGRYTQLVLDTGTEGGKHNSLELGVDETDFFAWVEIAASDERDTWRIVRERAPVYRFAEDDLEGTQTISYPDTRSRWLRVRILYADRELRVRSARVAEEAHEDAELDTIAQELRLVSSTASAGEASFWEVDLGYGNVPASDVRFATDRPAFHRPVVLSASEDGETWTELGQSEIYRYRIQEDGQREKLLVEFQEARGRYWRVTVFDRDDPPIEDLRVMLLGTPRWVVFRKEPGRRYRLLYGNSRVEAPEYEMARLTAREEAEGAVLAAIGAAELNDGYVSPEPWTERHPALLWIALGAVIVVLAWLAIRSLR